MSNSVLQEQEVAKRSWRFRHAKALVASSIVALSLAGAGFGASSAFAATKNSKHQSSHRIARVDAAAPAIVGTVQSVDATDNTFSVETSSSSTYTVDVSDSTTYRDYGVSSPGLSDVTVGANVAVFGTTSDTTITATSVGIGQPPKGGMGMAGCSGPMNQSSSGASGSTN